MKHVIICTEAGLAIANALGVMSVTTSNKHNVIVNFALTEYYHKELNLKDKDYLPCQNLKELPSQ